MRLNSFRGLSVLLLASVLLAVTAVSQNVSSDEIKDLVVRNVGAGQIDQSFADAHITSEVGSQLDRVKIARDVKSLVSTERFSSVVVALEPLSDGVRLIYSLSNKYRLSEEIDISGDDHFSKSKLLDWVGIRVSDLFDDQTLGVAAKNIKKEYYEDYYPDADIRWEITETDHEQGFAKARLVVSEGKRAKVKKVYFVGNSGVSKKVLEKIMRRRSLWDPLRLFRPKRYDANELAAARLQMRSVYLNRGYLDVEIEEPEVLRDSKGNLIINVKINEGIEYRFGDVSLSGVTIFPEADLKRYISVKKGNIASMAVVRMTSRSIQDYYGKRGYINTWAKPALNPDKATATVNVGFPVVEGSLARIRNIVIRGNTRTKDKVIRREVLVYPGDDYDQVSIRRSERRLSNLRYFKTVRGYPVDTSVADQKDLVFEVDEQRTGSLMMSAAFSSIDRMMGIIELSQSNFDLLGWPYFTGGGQKLRLIANFGERRERYEIDFTEPWFLDRKLSLGVNLYRSSHQTTDYDITRTGGAIRLRKKIPGPNSVTFSYRLEEVSGITDTNEYVFIDTEEPADFMEDDRLRSVLRASLNHDSTDKPFMPTKGTRASLFGHMSGGALGGDTDVYGMGLRATQFFPMWFRHVFSMRARYEVVEEFGDTLEPHYSERLFIGGGNTVRGYDYRDVGPKVEMVVPDSGRIRAYGGRSLAFASAEYTIPLGSLLRMAGFYDIGNVWREAYYFDREHLASSYGVGLRLDIPGFPIRLDWGWPIEKDDPRTDEEVFNLSIRYGF